MDKPKPRIDSLVGFLKVKIPNCCIRDEEITELKRLYPEVTYKDVNRVFHQAIKAHAMQPVSYMNRQLRLFHPSGDPFNTQVNQRTAYGKRIEKGTDWQAIYAKQRAERESEKQAYDKVHGAGAFDRKSQKENEELHQKLVELMKVKMK